MKPSRAPMKVIKAAEIFFSRSREQAGRDFASDPSECKSTWRLRFYYNVRRSSTFFFFLFLCSSWVIIMFIIGGAGIVILDQDFCSCVLVFCRNYVIRNYVHQKRLRRRMKEVKEKMD